MAAFTANVTSIEDFFMQLVEEPIWYEWVVLVLGVLFVLLCVIFWRTTFAVWSTIYLWVSFWSSHLVVLLLQCVLWVLIRPFTSKLRRTDLVGRFHMLAVFLVISLNPFWRVRLHNRNDKVPKGSIIMCNHLSYVDSFALASVLFPVMPRYVAMGTLFNMPIMGQVMRLGGHLPVWFTKENGGWGVKKGSVQKMMQKAGEYLEYGMNMCVFPEGGLSLDGHMLPFRDGFFKLAFERDVPIVPTAMWGNHDMFPPGDQFALAHPAMVSVNVGSAIHPSDFDSVEELKAHVRHEITQLRDTLPNFDLYETQRDSRDIVSPVKLDDSMNGAFSISTEQESPKLSI